MDITRKTDYTFRILAELMNSSGLLSVRSAAEANDIPYSFARIIQQSLARANIIENVRGAHGGMRLIVDPRTTTLREIVEAIQGDIIICACDTSGPNGAECVRKEYCKFNPIWCNASRMLADYLASVTLADVAAGSAQPVLPAYYCSPSAEANSGEYAKGGDGTSAKASGAEGSAAEGSISG